MPALHRGLVDFCWIKKRKKKVQERPRVGLRAFGYDVNNSFRFAALTSGKVVNKAVMIWEVGW